MRNCRIEIINIGPIKDVKFDLNKVNIFIGEQSSGKSTIAKIISFCTWVEKDVSLHQSLDDYSSNIKHFIEKLETFHKMKSYFHEKSEIKYESNIIKLHYKWSDFKISWVNKYGYKRTKISYIPSERSMAILPEIEKVELGNNYLKSFLFDWFDARKNYPKENELSILNLDAKYYYSESSKENHILNSRNSYDILLSNASSGLQSVTPMIVMIHYLTDYIYSEDQKSSYELDEIYTKTTWVLISELLFIPIYKKDITAIEERSKTIEELNKRIADRDSEVMPHLETFHKVRNNLFDTHNTSLIIEEPEQNLFPSTQKSLVYYLLDNINKGIDHFLTLTTHSPYVLYAINNCVMANIVQSKLSQAEKDKLNCLRSKIDAKFISIYQIIDGSIKSIQKEDGSISDNFFDEQMKEVMDEFYLMLNHY